MPLSNYQELVNAQLLQDIVRKHFGYVTNQNELVQGITRFLNNNSLCLNEFTGQWGEMFLANAKLMIQKNRYNQNLADSAFERILVEINDLNEKQRICHANQPPEFSVLDELKDKGYIKLNKLASHKDIKQMFDTYLHDKNVTYTAPISMTEDNGTLLNEVLDANKHVRNKLLIPANKGGNHWVLLIKEPGKKVTCWDPVQEQKDSFSCGYRITQKAFSEAGIKNALTEAPADNPTLICSRFIEMLVKTDKNLRSGELKVTSGPSPLVYLESSSKQEEVSKVIVEQKETQKQTDKMLAIALQYVYIDEKNVNLTSDQAYELAKTSIINADPAELQAMKQSVVKWARQQESERAKKSDINWTQNYHNSKDQTYPSCKNQVRNPTSSDDQVELDEFTSGSSSVFAN